MFMVDNPEVALEIETKIKNNLMGIEEEPAAASNGKGKKADVVEV
jgi:hypothetical protein